jgi:hypothetical protein
MKERRKANPKTIQGMRVPLSLRPNRPNEWRTPICNLAKECTQSMTNHCMYCIRNFSTWKAGLIVSKKDGKEITKPSKVMVPTYQSDYYVKKPENK